MVVTFFLAFALGTFLLVRAWVDKKISVQTKLRKSAGALTLIAIGCYMGGWRKAPEMIRPSMHRHGSITKTGQSQPYCVFRQIRN